jgi:hypothetical protein
MASFEPFVNFGMTTSSRGAAIVAAAENETQQLAAIVAGLLKAMSVEVDGSMACVACRGWSYHRWRKTCPCVCHRARAYLVANPGVHGAAAQGAEEQETTMRLERAFELSEKRHADEKEDGDGERRHNEN